MTHDGNSLLERVRFVESGVAFDVPALLAPSAPVATGSVFATATLEVERAGVAETDRTIRIVRDANAIAITTGGVAITGHVDGLAFRGRAIVARDHPRPAEAVTTSLAIALGEVAGGIALHAAAIARDDRAFVFVGPSGAGKSTACTLAPDARELAADRVLLVPTRDGLVAYRLAGGEPTGLALAESGVPVAAILRVHHDGIRTEASPARPAFALAILRAAALASSSLDESALLERLSALGSRTFVGTIYTRLDRPLDLVRIP